MGNTDAETIIGEAKLNDSSNKLVTYLLDFAMNLYSSDDWQKAEDMFEWIGEDLMQTYFNEGGAQCITKLLGDDDFIKDITMMLDLDAKQNGKTKRPSDNRKKSDLKIFQSMTVEELKVEIKKYDSRSSEGRKIRLVLNKKGIILKKGRR